MYEIMADGVFAFPSSVPGPGLRPQSPGPGPKLVSNSSGVQFVFIGPGP